MDLKQLLKIIVVTEIIIGGLLFNFAGVKVVSAQEAKIISYKEANNYYGQFVTVEGKVSRIRKTEEYKFLDFYSQGKDVFTVVIPRDAFDKFDFDLNKTYLNKKISVLGKVSKYKGKPEMIVIDPEQIKILK